MALLDFYIGPCVLESEDLALGIATKVKADLEEFGSDISLTFKGSFDKANRTSINSYRGPGIEEGLRILEKVRSVTGLPVLTDFHTPDQADTVASVVDVLQIPAFLCRQTDMIVAGAEAAKKHGRILKIKKGQFLAPWDAGNIVEKASSILPKDQILLTERGTSFGYNNMVVDMASFKIMKEFGVKTVHDATHCVQKPGGLGSATGGKRDQILVLARAAVAAGADGVFIEAHPDPEKALSDATTCLDVLKVKEIVGSLLKIKKAIN
ncbi:MAG: 3-deoxy-8-phosphooctulonate synthase [Bacteriovoracaceae bacterium]|nr:3-deoxy-8-phosphooctulonate synthase [Bacteriovoracaceae bacterium]